MPGALPPECDWPEWMRRAQDGDHAAYRMVLRAILPAIRRIAARRIFDEDLVEDAVQDTLMTIHRLRHTYDPARPLMPWVGAIAVSRAIDVLRRSGRTRRFEIMDDEAMDAAADHASADPGEAWGNEREVARLLGRLPQRQRMMVEMVKLKEMSLDDAAGASRMSVSAVKSLLHRALARLREDGNA
ncbi:RNA polymerase sigma-70 factor (ECF subfamily) [Novosphingobium sp. 1748]|uniref:sigma-70 family RNA polymerase sigma factor n=1 Tax=Novosphingobium sp. 1748 TaxID=2817760 RepID=UPI0028588056|nr:sigma-70 family RNA polymerase sigma factor [Novosphingobium sp. 1748]MDR6707408.1 RNA polymerase sigma-70 factor (ECF subfamily) [Novosphingobium sp. 1748]